MPIGCICPKEWADDAGRRAIAGVPDDVCFQTKPEIALQQLRQALADGVPPAPVLMDPAYGNDSKLRAGISELGLTYVAGILPTTMVWRPGEAPLPPASSSGRGRPGKRLRRDATHQPVSAKTLALELAADAWQQIKWRDGSNTPLSSRFARWRVRPARDDAKRSEPAAEEWLLIEWPEGEAQPDHYWLSTLPAEISLERMVDQAKLRWRIERDYLELKQEVGLGHYEGRGWRGFHHHATLCVAAYGFLISEKETIPPQDMPAPGEARNLPFPLVIDPEDLPLRSQRHMPQLNRNIAYPPRAGLGSRTRPDVLVADRGVSGWSSRMSDAVGLRPWPGEGSVWVYNEGEGIVQRIDGKSGNLVCRHPNWLPRRPTYRRRAGGERVPQPGTSLSAYTRLYGRNAVLFG